MIHGNGGGNSNDCWLPYVERELTKLNLEVINRSFPDPVQARAKYWLPFIEELGADANTVIIGHSSGAVAALRYAETHQLLGSILVGACYTDLGEASERVSGYYDHPWGWAAIRDHQQFIHLYASPTDPFIPIAEPRFIAKQLQAKYFELAKRGHFQDNELPELIKGLRKELSI
ncbi:MAG: alpha/beta hydrolase [Candidatus Saccharimonadales bacterium]